MTVRDGLRRSGSWGLGVLAAAALAAGLLLPQRAALAASEQVIYDFCSQSGCADGGQPFAGLIADNAGNFYGTTYAGGGSLLCLSGAGCGTVFRLAPDGTETVLYSFCLGSVLGCPDGANPAGGLVMDGAGNLYGTTASGGTTNSGTVFKLTPSSAGYIETVIHDFCPLDNCADGRNPQAGLIMDGAGNLYGTTHDGGAANAGTVFKLTPDLIGQVYTETVLHSFCLGGGGCPDGANPYAGLIMDEAGNLYGTTYLGGVRNVGTVFTVTPGGTESVLHSFCPQGSCVDGGAPYASVIMDAAGNLYGTTIGGGTAGHGVVFQLAPGGTETVLYNFCPGGGGCVDGGTPYSGLIMDGAGNLYGTTYYGGNTAPAACRPLGHVTGCGVAFKLTPGAPVWTETVLHAFCAQPSCLDGSFPLAGLILDPSGNAYGTTETGGNSGTGVVFVLSAPL